MKIISVSNQKTHRSTDSWGQVMLYPEGTTRIVKKGLFKKMVVKQVASIDCCASFDGAVMFNAWKTASH